MHAMVTGQEILNSLAYSTGGYGINAASNSRMDASALSVVQTEFELGSGKLLCALMAGKKRPINTVEHDKRNLCEQKQL